MKLCTTKFTIIVLINLLVFFMTSTAYAQEDTQDEIYVKEGTYLGLYLTQNNMSGDFDDSTLFAAPGEILDVPDVDDGSGFGIVLGGRTPKGALEIGYQRSKHDVSGVLYGEGEATYNVIDFNFKIDVLKREKIRPYVLLGFGIPWLTIEDDLYNIVTGSSEDATFTGFALNAGAGVGYYFRPQWAVTGGVIYRWNWFSSAEGGSLDDSLSEKAFCFNIGIAYTF